VRRKPSRPETPSARLVRDIRRGTRKQYSAEEKIRIVLDGQRRASYIAEPCLREGIAESLYYMARLSRLAIYSVRPFAMV